MDAPPALHREVAPDFRGAPEAELIDGSACGLEAVVGILRGDSHGHHMPQRLDLGGGLQVEGMCGSGVLAVQAAYVGNAVEGYARPHHDLAGGDVDPGHRLCDWVLHLQATQRYLRG